MANKCRNVFERVEVVERNIGPPFPCCPVNRQCLCKKTLIKKKINKAKQKRKGWWVEFYYTIEGFCRRNELVKKEMAFGFYYFFYDGCKVLFSSQICLFWNRTFPVLIQTFPFFESVLPTFPSRFFSFFSQTFRFFWVSPSNFI